MTHGHGSSCIAGTAIVLEMEEGPDQVLVQVGAGGRRAERVGVDLPGPAQGHGVHLPPPQVQDGAQGDVPREHADHTQLQNVGQG